MRVIDDRTILADVLGKFERYMYMYVHAYRCPYSLINTLLPLTLTLIPSPLSTSLPSSPLSIPPSVPSFLPPSLSPSFPPSFPPSLRNYMEDLAKVAPGRPIPEKWKLFFKFFCYIKPQNVPSDSIESVFLFEQVSTHCVSTHKTPVVGGCVGVCVCMCVGMEQLHCPPSIHFLPS